MRNAISKVVPAFMKGEAAKSGNGITDGIDLYLFGNHIAKHGGDGVYITNAGWDTATTKAWLRAIPGVNLYTKKKQTYLGGNAWDGQWTKVSDAVIASSGNRDVIIPATKWVGQGYRGSMEPVYGVVGASDTGMWPDSPCRTDVCKKELAAIRSILRKAGIKSKEIVTETSNVFCVRRHLIVSPMNLSKARKLAADYIDTHDTELVSVTS